MVDLVTFVAVALLVLGVVGSVVPAMPGAGLSLLGVYLYWWHTGFTSPGSFFIAAVTLVGVTAVAVEYLAGALSAKAGGASLWTSAVAALVGFALLFVVGPLGVIVGVVGTVYLVEFWRHEDARRSARAALYTTVGLLASSVVQVALTGSILVAFALAVLL